MKIANKLLPGFHKEEFGYILLLNKVKLLKKFFSLAFFHRNLADEPKFLPYLRGFWNADGEHVLILVCYRYEYEISIVTRTNFLSWIEAYIISSVLDETIPANIYRQLEDIYI